MSDKIFTKLKRNNKADENWSKQIVLCGWNNRDFLPIYFYHQMYIQEISHQPKGI